MNQKKEEIINWVKEHKKKLIIVGVSVAVVVAAIFACKNLEELEEVFKSLEKHVEPISEKITMIENNKTQSRAAHNVREHVRNLHEGWNASKEKKSLAEKRGIDLQPGQTLVDAYSTGSC